MFRCRSGSECPAAGAAVGAGADRHGCDGSDRLKANINLIAVRPLTFRAGWVATSPRQPAMAG